MHRILPVLLLCMLAAGAGHATGPPTLFSPAVDGHSYVPGSREVCWSEPVDLNDAKISSEIIGAFGLESELANDFVLSEAYAVSEAIGYGGYYNWVQGDPPVTSYNWKFYDDGGCVPLNLIAIYSQPAAAETFIGYDGYGYPTYKLESGYIEVSVWPNSRYWFGLQAGDHPFPPQWGRQGTGMVVTGCDTMFKSAFFAYPDWTPAGDLLGGPYEAAQELECWGIGLPTQETSWGAVRGLFR